MEQAQSAIKATFGPQLPGNTGDHGASNDTYPRGHQAPTPLVNHRMAGSKRTQLRQASVPPRDNAFSSREAAAITWPEMGCAESGSTLRDYMRASNEQLLEAARSLDKEAFTELSRRHLESVHKKVFSIVRSREDTEDVVQEALLKAYTHLSTFRGSCSFSTWLMAIAINTAFMLLRKRRVHSEVSFDQSRNDNQELGPWEFPDSTLDAEKSYARRRTMDLLSRAVGRLPLRLRGAFERYHVREQSMQQIADKLGLTVAAVKSRVLRGRLNLRVSLTKKGISIEDAYF